MPRSDSPLQYAACLAARCRELLISSLVSDYAAPELSNVGVMCSQYWQHKRNRRQLHGEISLANKREKHCILILDVCTYHDSNIFCYAIVIPWRSLIKAKYCNLTCQKTGRENPEIISLTIRSFNFR